MSSTWGKSLSLTVFGESHGTGVGMVLSGLPAGTPVCQQQLAAHLARRAPGGPLATSRKESDRPRILSGVLNGRATGAPIAMMIENEDARSGDYAQLAHLARPGHADFSAYVRYHGFNDTRSGGHLSGRVTAAFVMAGSLARGWLSQKGVLIGSHILSIGEEKDAAFPLHPTAELFTSLAQKPLPVLGDSASEAFARRIETARAQGDSVGGVIECAAIGVPAGWGSPLAGAVESRAAQLLFAVPGVKGVSFGAGYAASSRSGSENNDPFTIQDGAVTALTNNDGGVQGGVTNGMPILLTAAMRPTPTIAREQQTVDFKQNQPATLSAKGRHDPCIAVRAPVVVESMLALALAECCLEVEGER